MLTTNTLDKVQGVEVLTAACAACKETVEKQGGRLLVKEAARAVTERDDRLLTEQLTALEAANRFVAALLRSHDTAQATSSVMQASKREGRPQSQLHCIVSTVLSSQSCSSNRLVWQRSAVLPGAHGRLGEHSGKSHAKHP